MSSVEEHTRQCSLSKREQEVISCVFRGMSNEAIAEEVGICVQVVKNYLGRAFLKLHVSSRYDLIAQAAKSGGLHLWTYSGEPYVEPPQKHYATAEDKRAAELSQIKKLPSMPGWIERFAVEPTMHECRLIDMILEDPEISAMSIARRVRGSSMTGVTSTLSRIYNKAGVRSRAGLVAFLLHDRATHKTGTSVVQDGGTARRQAF